MKALRLLHLDTVSAMRLRPDNSLLRHTSWFRVSALTVWALIALVAGSGCAGESGSSSVPVDSGRTADDDLFIDFVDRFDRPMVRRAAGPFYDFGASGRPEDRLDGWGAIERTADGRGSFAWATNTTARLRLVVAELDEGWLHFSAASFALGPGAAQTTVVSLNGMDVGVVTLVPGPFAVYSLPLSGGALASGDNVVAFDFAYAGSPVNPTSQAGDPRTLAAAFDYVAITADAGPPATGELPALVQALVSGPETDRVRLASGEEVEFHLVVPAGGHVDFGMAGTSPHPRSGLRGEVAIRSLDERSPPSGDTRNTTAPDNDVKEEVFFSREAGDTVIERQADLSQWVGRRVAVVFRVVGGQPQDSIDWVEPQLRGYAGAERLHTNVVLIVIDTLRADYLGSYGGEAETPHLDALAASGVRFDRAYSHVPITVPSHSSMFTSLLPSEHSALTNGSILGEEHVTWAELMRDHYRRTAGFVSLGVLQNHAGTAQGFDVYHDDFGRDWWKNAEEMNTAILPWLASARSPFFLWAHYSDPHEPYSPPGRDYTPIQLTYRGETVGTMEAQGRTSAFELEFPSGISHIELSRLSSGSRQPLRLNNLRTTHPEVTVTCDHGCRARQPGPAVREFVTALPATLTVSNAAPEPAVTTLLMQLSEDLTTPEARVRYREEVEYLDTQVGALLDRIDAVSDDTLIIMTADHGEDLGEHGSPGHVSRLYEQVVRVPLVVSWPGEIADGLTVADPVAHIDILPTVLDLLSITTADDEEAPRRAGRSLRPFWTGASPAPQIEPIVVETFRPESPRSRKGVITAGHKLIVTQSPTDEDGPPEHVELYDLAADPAELDNRARDDTATTEALTEMLRARIRLARAGASRPQEQTLSTDQLEQLRSLGYVR